MLKRLSWVIITGSFSVQVLRANDSLRLTTAMFGLFSETGKHDSDPVCSLCSQKRADICTCCLKGRLQVCQCLTVRIRCGLKQTRKAEL